MYNKGFIISIPQIVLGLVSMFVGVIGVRVVWPILQPVFDMEWSSGSVRAGAMIGVFLVITFIFYVIVYGTVMGRKPNVLGIREDN